METVVANLAYGLPADRFASEIWCLEALDQLGSELRARGLRVHLFGRRSRRDLSLFVRLARELKRRRIDVVHCHDDFAWFYCSIAARAGGGPKLVMTFHGRRADIRARHLYEQRLMARFTDVLVCVSRALQGTLGEQLALPIERLPVILNGIPMPASTPGANDRRAARAALRLPDNAFVVGTVGEMSPVKNLCLAVQAVAAAKARIPRVRLVFVGDGSERLNIESAVSNAGLADRVLMTGVRRDVPQLLPAFDAYVCASNYEGTSLSIIEAMSNGLAVIATDVGGNSELLGGGEHGVLVPSNDAAAMADALANMYERPRVRIAIGERAAQSARARYSIRSMTAAYAALYESVVGSPAAAAAIDRAEHVESL